jgi:hypothetical protein
VDMDAHPTNNSPETTARDGAVPSRSWTHTRSPLTISQAFEGFLELPAVVVLAVLWIMGTALLGSIALVLYMTGAGLVRLVAGSI